MGEHPLDRFNRLIIVVVALAIVLVALFVLLLTWVAPGETITRIADFANYLNRHDDRETKVIISLSVAVIALLMLTVIVAELTPSPTRKIRVRSMKSGEAVITTSQIASRINDEVTRVPHIGACAAEVLARGKKVEVVLDLHVDAGANLSQAADEACRRAHLLVERQLGIEMASMPRARLHYRELRLGGDGAAVAPRRREISG